MTTRFRADPVLPREVLDLATRLGARGSVSGSSVTLTQSGTMRDQPTAHPMRFSARQTTSLRRCEFEWRASTGPFGCISVVDALKGEGAEIDVRIFHLFRVASAKGGTALLKGEIMRYLAELAWAPDAILGNPSLDWTVVDSQVLRVRADNGDASGEVELRLDESGRIASVIAKDRPRKEGDVFVERPWLGQFFDYKEFQGRLLPTLGEVGWVLDGQTFVAWRGNLLSWAIA
ncbi:DUF6544 family protein [Mesorhizobium sp. M8A.F.Ca.ET.142.01.1.1]|uniref:DUF6544 family protein n=1 Tax=unclassified Mesorhizobium TaxID=325217 RepID=UPI0032B1BCAF